MNYQKMNTCVIADLVIILILYYVARVMMQIVSNGPGDAATTVSNVMPYIVSII